MRKNFLATMLTAIISLNLSTAWAEDTCKNYHDADIVCRERLTDNNGNNSCGENCSYKVIEENGTQVLHIYKTNSTQPATIKEGAFSPQYYAQNQILNANGQIIPLQNIVLDNDFETIGNWAFANSGANISSANGKFNVGTGYDNYLRTTLRGDVYLDAAHHALIEAATIYGDVIVSDNVDWIGNYTFSRTTIYGDLVLPASITQFNPLSLSTLNISGKIYCATGAETCYKLAQDGCNNDNNCLTALQHLFDNNKFTSYPDGCTKLNADLTCLKCANSNFKLSDGICYRIRYTPAEAAEVAGESNTIFLYYK